MRIAPRLDPQGGDWTVGDYEDLELDEGAPEAAWQTAITIFEHRIRGRFLEPIDILLTMEHSGFAVLALDCLLIETLQQFWEGEEETPRGKGEDYFVKFLTKPPLGRHFDPAKAKSFYKDVRCGILHQAELKGSWLVQRKRDLEPVSPRRDEPGWIVQRRKFHGLIVQAFERYATQLRDPSKVGLRQNFKKKMDSICRVAEAE